MSHLALLAVAALTILIGVVSDAYAGLVPPPVKLPEPSTLAVLAAGLGIAALFKFRKRK